MEKKLIHIFPKDICVKQLPLEFELGMQFSLSMPIATLLCIHAHKHMQNIFRQQEPVQTSFIKNQPEGSVYLIFYYIFQFEYKLSHIWIKFMEKGPLRTMDIMNLGHDIVTGLIFSCISSNFR